MNLFGRFSIFVMFIILTGTFILNLNPKMNKSSWDLVQRLNYNIVYGSEKNLKDIIDTDLWFDALERQQQSVFEMTTKYLNNILYSQKKSTISLSLSNEAIGKVTLILNSVTSWENEKTLSFLSAVILNPQYPNQIKTVALNSMNVIQKKLNNPEFEAFMYSNLTPEVANNDLGIDVKN